jgi:hypothetical protein
MFYTINFTCPSCGKETAVIEEESCPVANEVTNLEITSWEDDESGNFVKAIAVEADWGPREVHEPDFSEPYWVCSRCLELLDSDIKDHADLFNWLYQRGMVQKDA